jgi:hypothetical protein
MPVYPLPLAIFIVCVIATIIAVAYYNTYYNTYLKGLDTLDLPEPPEPPKVYVPYERVLTDSEFDDLVEHIERKVHGYDSYLDFSSAYKYLSVVDSLPLFPDGESRTQMLTFLMLVAEAESC